MLGEIKKEGNECREIFKSIDGRSRERNGCLPFVLKSTVGGFRVTPQEAHVSFTSGEHSGPVYVAHLRTVKPSLGTRQELLTEESQEGRLHQFVSRLRVCENRVFL